MIRSNSFAQGCNTREEIQSMLIGSLDRYEKEIKRIVIWAKDPKVFSCGLFEPTFYVFASF